MSGTKGMDHYPFETKLAAVQLHEKGNLSNAEIAKRLGLRQAARIRIWARQYQEEGEAGLRKQGSGRPRKARGDEERMAQLEMENALLKKFHTELRKLMPARRDIGSSSTTEETTL
jgi:transposase-like protein